MVTASKAMLAYGTDHGGLAGATDGDLVKIEPSLGQARNLTVDGDAQDFTVSVDSAAAAGAAFSIERTADGAMVRDCTKPGTGALPRRAPTRTATAGSGLGSTPSRVQTPSTRARETADELLDGPP